MEDSLERRFGEDLERRFGGLARLYGDAAYSRLRGLSLAVVGLGGVGSWAAEALARHGVARLVLVDLDHVAASNINRQIQATTLTLGQSKALALQERIALIHPGCEVHAVEEFVEDGNWPGLLPCPVDGVIDACDQVHAKTALAVWARDSGTPLVCVGAAGGKRQPQRVAVDDLAHTTHDPLLASLRQRLRQRHGFAKGGASGGKAARVRPMGVQCVYSTETVALPPVAQCETSPSETADVAASLNALQSAPQGLNCHGYGSTVTVTATFGLVAAAALIDMTIKKV
ncbi:tRNA threonylcarbamoyladenosine dehydratase [Amphibiibacter pelophylacis]|uniref:tRNA threonylcarbamoyladenosine dehydratase n=1 Tax=Amphibiibacter pelophylacis TaxID=1799477 RepID=A0ACC6P5K5_9BURK